MPTVASAMRAAIQPNTFRKIQSSYNVSAAVGSVEQRRGIFYSDVGLGPTSPDSLRYFDSARLSADDWNKHSRALFRGPQTGEAAKTKADYARTYEMVNGEAPQTAKDIHGPWVDFKFVNRDRIDDSAVPYVHYYRQAVATAASRGGDVHFYLGGFDAMTYIDSIVKTESQTQMPFRQYASKISLPDLVAPEADDRFAAVGGRPEGRPTITSIEFFDATMGEFQDTGKKFNYCTGSGKSLNFDDLKLLQDHALYYARHQDNIRSLAQYGKMNQAAETAISNLQRYIDTGKLG